MLRYYQKIVTNECISFPHLIAPPINNLQSSEIAKEIQDQVFVITHQFTVYSTAQPIYFEASHTKSIFDLFTLNRFSSVFILHRTRWLFDKFWYESQDPWRSLQFLTLIVVDVFRMVGCWDTSWKFSKKIKEPNAKNSFKISSDWVAQVSIFQGDGRK